MEYRRELNEPPFSQLVRLTYVHVNDAACKAEAERMKRRLEAEIASRGLSILILSARRRLLSPG